MSITRLAALTALTVMLAAELARTIAARKDAAGRFEGAAGRLGSAERGCRRYRQN